MNAPLIWKPAGAAALAAAAFILWLSLSSFPLMERQVFDNSVYLEPFSPGREYVQTFSVDGDDLSRVDVHIDKSRPDAEGEVTLKLVETSRGPGERGVVEGEVVREKTVPAEEINPFERYRFRFDPIADSASKDYALVLTGEFEGAEDARPRASSDDPLADGALYVDGVRKPGDLSITYYRSTGLAGLQDKLEPFRPWPLNRLFLMVFLCAAGAAAFGWLLWRTVAPEPEAAVEDDDFRRQREK